VHCSAQGDIPTIATEYTVWSTTPPPHHPARRRRTTPRQPASAQPPQTFWIRKLSHLISLYEPSLIIYNHLEFSPLSIQYQHQQFNTPFICTQQSNDTAGDFVAALSFRPAKSCTWTSLPPSRCQDPSYVFVTDLPSQPPPISPYRDITKDHPHSKKVHRVDTHSCHTTYNIHPHTFTYIHPSTYISYSITTYDITISHCDDGSAQQEFQQTTGQQLHSPPRISRLMLMSSRNNATPKHHTCRSVLVPDQTSDRPHVFCLSMLTPSCRYN
jgi:hypothetical protein